MIRNNLFLSLFIFFLLIGFCVYLVSVSSMLILYAVPVLLAYLFAKFITYRINKSVNQLTDKALQASWGQINQTDAANGDNELQPLGNAINDLTEKYVSLAKDNRYDREELKLILNSINEALWIQNRDGQIIWSSFGFNDLFTNYVRGKNQYYWEVVRDPDLLEQIKTTKNLKEQQLTEITMDEHFYLLKINYNPKSETTVFIMQNIDLLRQTEQMKKDFIINLAHELRTPLTAIKGFSEAITDSTEKDKIRYLNIIRNHTDRLISLVSDLQALSHLERLPELNMQQINLLTFFDNISALYHQELQERNLTLTIEADVVLPRLTVDPYKFEQIFINLIDNALRYTSEGGITISIKHENNSIRIEVYDTGIGIEAEHLPRIFERFYVTDPSRNRGLSGTGLGLAIAKHSVLLHGGTIEVQSTTGKGACFIMNFPLPVV